MERGKGKHKGVFASCSYGHWGLNPYGKRGTKQNVKSREKSTVWKVLIFTNVGDGAARLIWITSKNEDNLLEFSDEIFATSTTFWVKIKTETVLHGKAGYGFAPGTQEKVLHNSPQCRAKRYDPKCKWQKTGRSGMRYVASLWTFAKQLKRKWGNSVLGRAYYKTSPFSKGYGNYRSSKSHQSCFVLTLY